MHCNAIYILDRFSASDHSLINAFFWFSRGLQKSLLPVVRIKRPPLSCKTPIICRRRNGGAPGHRATSWMQNFNIDLMGDAWKEWGEKSVMCLLALYHSTGSVTFINQWEQFGKNNIRQTKHEYLNYSPNLSRLTRARRGGGVKTTVHPWGFFVIAQKRRRIAVRTTFPRLSGKFWIQVTVCQVARAGQVTQPPANFAMASRSQWWRDRFETFRIWYTAKYLQLVYLYHILYIVDLMSCHFRDLPIMFSSPLNTPLTWAH